MYLSLNEHLEKIKNKLPPSAEKEDIMYSAAFTGYRPEKLPFGYDYECEAAQITRHALYGIYEKLYLKGYRYFLTGGAMGSDLMAADVIAELKRNYGKRARGVTSYICLPCHDHVKKWNPKEKEHLEKLLNDGAYAFYVSDRPYYSGCMQVRNKYMVDTSAVLIAVYDGKPGGTRNTLEYAQKIRKKIIIIDPNDGSKNELFLKAEDTSHRLSFLNSTKIEYRLQRF